MFKGEKLKNQIFQNIKLFFQSVACLLVHVRDSVCAHIIFHFYHSHEPVFFHCNALHIYSADITGNSCPMRRRCSAVGVPRSATRGVRRPGPRDRWNHEHMMMAYRWGWDPPPPKKTAHPHRGGVRTTQPPPPHPEEVSGPPTHPPLLIHLCPDLDRMCLQDGRTFPLPTRRLHQIRPICDPLPSVKSTSPPLPPASSTGRPVHSLLEPRGNHKSGVFQTP